jgi:hypothetical protein
MRGLSRLDQLLHLEVQKVDPRSVAAEPVNITGRNASPFSVSTYS